MQYTLFRGRFVELQCDDATRAYIADQTLTDLEGSPLTEQAFRVARRVVQRSVAGGLRTIMCRTDANGYAMRGDMFVFSTEHARQLLQNTAALSTPGLPRALAHTVTSKLHVVGTAALHSQGC